MFVRQNNTLKWNWILIGAVITCILVFMCVFGLDEFLYPLIHNQRCNPWTFGDGFMCWIAALIGKIFSVRMWLYVTTLSVFIFFIYKAITNEYDFRFALKKIKNSNAFYIFCSVVTTVITCGILKVLIGRSRPIIYEALNTTVFVPGTFESVFNSMPSGHTAASFAGLVMLGMLTPRIKWATWTLAIIIAISRVYIGAHWVGDVIFGAFIGMVCADIVKVALKNFNQRNKK